MVRIEHVKRPTPTPPPATPYDLIQLLVDGQPIVGRPYQFDQQDNPTRPTRCTTICPRCAQGMEVDLPQDFIPPVEVGCPHCFTQQQAQQPPLPDPFCNPQLEGLMELDEVDTDLVRVLSQAPAGTVAERLQQRLDARALAPEAEPT